MRPKALILRTAGTNCDKETELAFQLAGAETSLLHINSLKVKKGLLSYQIICIPGGFSYGDDLGAGKIFAWEFLHWFKEELVQFLKQGGLILGICNGFQVLVKAGLLPDIDFKPKVTLTFNDSSRFEDRWVYLKIEKENRGKGIWFKDLPDIINLPVAHGEGKFYAQEETLQKLEKNQQVSLRYVDSRGRLLGYPYNPNGSLHNIAGIVDKQGRILGLMPHPERFIFEHHYPFWKRREKTRISCGVGSYKDLNNVLCRKEVQGKNPDVRFQAAILSCWGLQIFKNAVDYFK